MERAQILNPSGRGVTIYQYWQERSVSLHYGEGDATERGAHLLFVVNDAWAGENATSGCVKVPLLGTKSL